MELRIEYFFVEGREIFGRLRMDKAEKFQLI